MPNRNQHTRFLITYCFVLFFFFSSRRRHTRFKCDWSSDVCSSDLFFFPTLFMHRVVSPNDVFYNFDPWSTVRKVDVQNSLLNDPPTSYFTLMSLLKNDRHAFHWNPYVASRIPGFGSSASAVLPPVLLLPHHAV